MRRSIGGVGGEAVKVAMGRAQKRTREEGFNPFPGKPAFFGS